MEDQAVIIDNGSGVCKAGFAGEGKPSSTFASIIGRPRIPGVILGENAVVVGDDAQKKRGILSLRYPVEHGVVVNWDDMEVLWNHTFHDALRIDPRDHPTMLSEAALNPKNNREKTLSVMFETFQVPSMHFGVSPVVSLFATGRTTGVVLEAGDGVTHTVPIFEGYVLPHAILRLDLAGRDLTDRLCQLLGEKGLEFTTVAEREVVRVMKEKLCYIAPDYEQAVSMSAASERDCETTYELPDGQKIEVGNERFKCPEALFQPSMVGLDQQGGIHNLLHDSVRKCDLDIRRLFLKNIILAGGSSMFEGMATRLTNEISQLAPPGVDVSVCADVDRKYNCWIGMSILADITSFKDSWITKAEFEEHGAGIVHKKCPA